MEPLHLQISTNLGKNQKNTGNTNYKPVQGKLEKEKPTRSTANPRSTTIHPEAGEGGELIDKAETNHFDPCNDDDRKIERQPRQRREDRDLRWLPEKKGLTA
jgi:hypothetical protein